MVWVVKSDGSRQPFRKEKIVKVCLRMGVTLEEAHKVANRIEKKVYPGIATRRILTLVFTELSKIRPEIRHRIDLRLAVSLLRPKPEFERWVGLLFRAQGYRVTPPQVVRGRCVEHEIDGILRRGRHTIYLEVKHHFPPHVRVELDELLATNSVFQDLVEGYETGHNTTRFTKALLVTNTSLTRHALRYARCRGIRYLTWNRPPGRSLERLIERKKLYPVTILKGVDQAMAEKLGDVGVILLRQLVEREPAELARATHITKRKLTSLAKRAKELLGS